MLLKYFNFFNFFRLFFKKKFSFFKWNSRKNSSFLFFFLLNFKSFRTNRYKYKPNKFFTTKYNNKRSFYRRTIKKKRINFFFNLDKFSIKFFKNIPYLSRIRSNMSRMSNFYKERFIRSGIFVRRQKKNLLVFKNKYRRKYNKNNKRSFNFNIRYLSHKTKIRENVFSDLYTRRWDGLRRIFFKHNLRKMLKTSRKVTGKFFGFYFFHEKRITKFIVSYKNRNFKKYIEMVFLRISSLLFMSKITYNSYDIKFFIDSNLVYVNGLTLKNVNYITSKFDIISIKISWKIYQYIIFNNFKSLFSRDYNGFRRGIKFLDDRNRYLFDNYKYSNRIDSFKYYETDFKTMTIFVIYDYYFIYNTKLNFFQRNVPLCAITSLNWKYLN